MSGFHQKNIRRKTERKREIVAPHCHGKRVLHIGCGGGEVGRPSSDFWTHEWIDGAASSSVGIDIDKDAVEAAKAQGYDVRHADAQSFDIDQKFDAIAVLNVIEHLESPGEMLQCARKHLSDGGDLLITTPYPHLPWWTLQALKNGGDPVPPAEHTMWLGPSTIEELLSRVGFGIDTYERWGWNRIGQSRADRVWRLFEKAASKLPVFHNIDKPQQFIIASLSARSGE
mgnify:CR=1 FL=1